MDPETVQAPNTEKKRVWIEYNYERLLQAIVMQVRDFRLSESSLGDCLAEMIFDQRAVFDQDLPMYAARKRLIPLEEYVVNTVTKRCRRYGPSIRRGEGPIVRFSQLSDRFTEEPPGSKLIESIDSEHVFDDCDELDKGLKKVEQCLRMLDQKNRDQFCAVIHCIVCDNDRDKVCVEVVNQFVTQDRLENWRKRDSGTKASDCSRGRAYLRGCLVDSGFRFRDLDTRLGACCASKHAPIRSSE